MSKETILILEDDDLLSWSMQEDLSQQGYKTIAAKTGEEALEHIMEEIPDLVLLDIMLPGADGWEIYDRIKKNKKWANIPILFLTALTDKFTLDAGRFLGDDFIEKPFEVHDLKNRIEQAIARYKE